MYSSLHYLANLDYLTKVHVRACPWIRPGAVLAECLLGQKRRLPHRNVGGRVSSIGRHTMAGYTMKLQMDKTLNFWIDVAESDRRGDDAPGRWLDFMKD